MRLSRFTNSLNKIIKENYSRVFSYTIRVNVLYNIMLTVTNK